MTRRPWWLWLATASFVAYFAFVNWSVYYGREALGFVTLADGRGVFARTVTPGGPASIAGLIDGDRVVSFGDLAIRDSFDLPIVQANISPGIAMPIHARGMVQRDLKPENVFLSGETGVEIAKVLDFGIVADYAAGGHPIVRSGLAASCGCILRSLAVA